MTHTLSVSPDEKTGRYHVIRDGDKGNVAGSFPTESEAIAYVARLATQAEARLDYQERVGGPLARLTDEDYSNLFNRTKLHLRSAVMLALPNEERRARVLEHKRWLETIKARINVAIVSADDEVTELDAEVDSMTRQARQQADKKYIPVAVKVRDDKADAKAKLEKLLAGLNLEMPS